MCKLSPFLFDRIQIIPVLRKRMETLVFFITVQNHGIAAVYKHNPDLLPDRFHIVDKIIKIGKIVSAPHIRNKRRLFACKFAVPVHFSEFREKLQRHVINAEITDILQKFRRLCFSGSRHPGQYQKAHAVYPSIILISGSSITPFCSKTVFRIYSIT